MDEVTELGLTGVALAVETDAVVLALEVMAVLRIDSNVVGKAVIVVPEYLVASRVVVTSVMVVEVTGSVRVLCVAGTALWRPAQRSYKGPESLKRDGGHSSRRHVRASSPSVKPDVL